MAKRLCPSAGCTSTSLAAMVVTPPGRFSTITFQPSSSDNSLATIRLMMSGGVLAETGATRRMVPVGNGAGWACAATAVAAQTAATATSQIDGHIAIRRVAPFAKRIGSTSVMAVSLAPYGKSGG